MASGMGPGMAFATLGTETSKTKGLRLSGHAQSQAGFDQAASSSYVTAAGLRASGTGERPPSACGSMRHLGLEPGMAVLCGLFVVACCCGEGLDSPCLDQSMLF